MGIAAMEWISGHVRRLLWLHHRRIRNQGDDSVCIRDDRRGVAVVSRNAGQIFWQFGADVWM